MWWILFVGFFLIFCLFACSVFVLLDILDKPANQFVGVFVLLVFFFLFCFFSLRKLTQLDSCLSHFIFILTYPQISGVFFCSLISRLAAICIYLSFFVKWLLIYPFGPKILHVNIFSLTGTQTWNIFFVLLIWRNVKHPPYRSSRGLQLNSIKLVTLKHLFLSSQDLLYYLLKGLFSIFQLSLLSWKKKHEELFHHPNFSLYISGTGCALLPPGCEIFFFFFFFGA